MNSGVKVEVKWKPEGRGAIVHAAAVTGVRANAHQRSHVKQQKEKWDHVGRPFEILPDKTTSERLAKRPRQAR